MSKENIVDSELATKPSVLVLRWLTVVLFVGGAAGSLYYFVHHPTIIRGDGWEYLCQLESLYQHRSPELRASDVDAVNALTVARGLGTVPQPPIAIGYHEAPNGEFYGIHFWGYALTAIPAKAWLQATGRNELAAFQLTNTLCFLVALAVVLFVWDAPDGKRWLYAGLITVGPVLWYLEFTGSEIFSWAFITMAIVAYDSNRFALCSAAAALAALQNPTLIFFCGAGIALAIWECRWREAVAAGMASGLAFLPMAFSQYLFGRPSLIADGFVSASYISWAKTWGYAFDFNQGLISYTPLFVFGAFAGALGLIIRNSVKGLVMLLTIAAVAVATEMQVNWNSGCLGIQRYLVWQIPALAWVMLEGLGSSWAARAVTSLTILSSGIIALIGLPSTSYVEHHPVAKWVLTHYPRLYHPEPEVFIERQIQTELPWPRVYPVPVGFADAEGNITKVLVDGEDLEAVAEVFWATPEYLVTLRDEATRHKRFFYSHPPRGSLRVRR
ncbi:MAG: hypothetical protein RMJ56_02375 [Gemmataceae bacterium]|nr:hypothetical protein [Gemmata sp.]MDW8196432.1 hypothetical protein [Gemmataceae bacterium]